MFAMNRAAAHPKKPFVAFQSTDNSICTFSSNDRFRRHKKVFKGPLLNSGYAIDLNFSPDGEYLASGSGSGELLLYSWRTTAVVSRISVSESPVISCEWHPRESSKVVTGDMNGIIKYWD
jgi:pre-mRNA-processing factor 17